MRIVCITLCDESYGKDGPHQARARAHFADVKLHHVDWFYGFHAKRIGAEAIYRYEERTREGGPGRTMGPIPSGIWLSHRGVWASLLLVPDEPVLVLEDDAKFTPESLSRIERAVADCRAADPKWQFLFAGSCCAGPLAKVPLRGEVFRITYPMCMHAYVVSGHRAAKRLCELADAERCIWPIDIGMAQRMLPALAQQGGVYTLWPRAVEQFDVQLDP